MTNQNPATVSRRQKQKGATVIEYALIAALIAIAAIAAMKTVGTNVSTKFSVAGSALT